MKHLGFWMMVACLAGALGSSIAAPAPPQGQVVAASMDVTATVAKIDQKTREVTLKAEDGEEYSFVAGADVKNLAQVKKGDLVTATYTAALAYEVKKGGTTGAEMTAAAATAPLGAKPAGMVAQTTTVTVKVVAIDAKAPSITLKGPEGHTKTVKVKDASKLEGVSVGDTVQLTYAEAIELKVEKASKN
jgi:Cu/Ag efflux protein CusF